MGYIAFVLTEESRKFLLETLPPVHPRVIAHHITLNFGVEQELLGMYPSRGICYLRWHNWDEKAQVGVVTFSPIPGCPDMKCQPNGTLLHVTISIAEGVKPVYAGVLASYNSSVRKEVMPKVLCGNIKWFP